MAFGHMMRQLERTWVRLAGRPEYLLLRCFRNVAVHAYQIMAEHHTADPTHSLPRNRWGEPHTLLRWLDEFFQADDYQAELARRNLGLEVLEQRLAAASFARKDILVELADLAQRLGEGSMLRWACRDMAGRLRGGGASAGHELEEFAKAILPDVCETQYFADVRPALPRAMAEAALHLLVEARSGHLAAMPEGPVLLSRVIAEACGVSGDLNFSSGYSTDSDPLDWREPADYYWLRRLDAYWDDLARWLCTASDGLSAPEEWRPIGGLAAHVAAHTLYLALEHLKQTHQDVFAGLAQALAAVLDDGRLWGLADARLLEVQQPKGASAGVEAAVEAILPFALTAAASGRLAGLARAAVSPAHEEVLAAGLMAEHKEFLTAHAPRIGEGATAETMARWFAGWLRAAWRRSPALRQARPAAMSALTSLGEDAQNQASWAAFARKCADQFVGGFASHSTYSRIPWDDLSAEQIAEVFDRASLALLPRPRGWEIGVRIKGITWDGGMADAGFCRLYDPRDWAFFSRKQLVASKDLQAGAEPVLLCEAQVPSAPTPFVAESRARQALVLLLGTWCAPASHEPAEAPRYHIDYLYAARREDGAEGARGYARPPALPLQYDAARFALGRTIEGTASISRRAQADPDSLQSRLVRALHWHLKGQHQDSWTDQLLAFWIALENLLDEPHPRPHQIHDAISRLCVSWRDLGVVSWVIRERQRALCTWLKSSPDVAACADADPLFCGWRLHDSVLLSEPNLRKLRRWAEDEAVVRDVDALLAMHTPDQLRALRCRVDAERQRAWFLCSLVYRRRNHIVHRGLVDAVDMRLYVEALGSLLRKALRVVGSELAAEHGGPATLDAIVATYDKPFI